MKYLFCFIFLFFSTISLCQEKFSKEISLITDNDLYVSTNRDRYYTSGIFLTYRHLIKNTNKKLAKKIFEWQLGHKMFTPHKPIVRFLIEHDRPFAAYLYSSLNIKRIYKKNKILNTSLQLGIIGPSALGDEIQNSIHNIYGFREVTGWKYQIENALGLNFGTEYVHFLGKDTSNTFDASWVSSANVGTVFTDISSGLHLRLSFLSLQKIQNSIAFNTNLNNTNSNDKRQIESFFFFKPTLRYALYDATLQGSFLNTSSMITKELVPVVFNMELGYKFTANRFNFGYVFNYNTSKSKNLRYSYGNKYGTIIVNYLIH